MENDQMNQENTQAQREKIIQDATQLVDSMSRGTLMLTRPIRSRSEDVNEIKFDFNNLTSEDLLNAMDRDPKNRDASNPSSRQCLALFAMSAAKETEGLDWKDIMQRICPQDAAVAVQSADFFYKMSLRVGNMRISRD